MKAHDVRHLCVCLGCHKIADNRETVNRDGQYWGASKFKRRHESWHPQCFYVKFGKQNVLALPQSEREKFRLSDVPAGVMKTLLRLRDDAPTPKTAQRLPVPKENS